jgi:hypothetical protein
MDIDRSHNDLTLNQENRITNNNNDEENDSNEMILGSHIRPNVMMSNESNPRRNPGVPTRYRRTPPTQIKSLDNRRSRVLYSNPYCFCRHYRAMTRKVHASCA